MGFVTELLTTADVATILQVSPQRVRTLARDGVLSAVRDEGGAGWLFRAADVRDYQDHRPRRRGPGAHVPAGVGAGGAPGQGVEPAWRVPGQELASLRAENEELRAEVARLRAEREGLMARLQRSRALSEVLARELG